MTMEEDVTSKIELYKYLNTLSGMVARRIRKENKYASTICVILKDNSFKRYSHQKKLKNPISSYEDIYKYSKEVLDAFYKNEPIRLIGIRLDNLKEERTYQTSLFEEPKQENELDKIMDNINSKYGKNVIKRASYIDNSRF
jgi:DNA polymerase-4